MCGIAGYFYKEDEQAGLALISNMTGQLCHRGPDDKGAFIDDTVALGFRRLSIVDISTGNQPLFNEDGSLVLICNGEIFNYQELRASMLAKGHSFATGSDVEVILHLYEEYGADLLNKLNGQFAFALYDRNKKQMLLARDHVGVAPLFYYYERGRFLFASEIKALLKDDRIARKVNLRGLDQILSFPGLVSPVTMFENIHCVRPGHFLVMKEDSLTDNEYWDMTYPPESMEAHGIPESYYVEKLDHLLSESIQYRLKADVEVGFYLSGGLDSSLIASYVHRLFPGVQRHSFSIAFRDRSIDETYYQQLMSKAVGSCHHSCEFDPDEIISRLKQAVYHAETPLKESYNTCSLALSQLVRDNNLKVVLTGEGADELFAGYVGYRFDRQQRINPFEVMDNDLIMENRIREDLWGDGAFLYERDYYAFGETKEALYSDEVNKTRPQFDSVRAGLVDKTKLSGRSLLHKRSYIDFKLRISDHLLADHGDRVGFAHSVEARYPFLDINVLQFVKTIPSGLKLKGLQEKYILKKCAGGHIPAEIKDREKFSFVAPGSPFLLKKNKEWINDILSYETIRRQGYFNPDTIEKLKKIYVSEDFHINQTFENDLLMTVLTFGIFLETFQMPGIN